MNNHLRLSQTMSEQPYLDNNDYDYLEKQNKFPMINIIDLDNNEVSFVANSEPIFVPNFNGLKLVLNQPIFFCIKARISRKQHKNQPVLLLTENDWYQLSRSQITHSGAFGMDFDIVTAKNIKKQFVPSKSTYNLEPKDEQTDPLNWVVVWKFPADLNKIPSFRPIVRVPLPVGYYSFLDDQWWTPRQSPITHSSIPLNNCAVEKMRTDLPNNRGCVHHLELIDNSDIQVAAISSSYFIEGYWETNPHTIPKIVNMLIQLYKVGIYAFPCYSQHHAIVFYIDLNIEKPTILSPRLFCHNVLNDKKRSDAVITALFSAVLPDKHDFLNRWFNNYKMIYQ